MSVKEVLMEQLSHMIEFFSKLVFGIHLTLSFSGVTYKTDKKAYQSILLALVSLLMISFFLLGEEQTIFLYPLLIHCPLILFLFLKMKSPLMHALVSLFFAFQFLSPRYWLGYSVAFFFHNDPIVLNIAISILSIPFAWLIDKFFAPDIAAFKGEDHKMILLVGLAPIAYYIMTYTMVIYSDILVDGGASLVDFIDGSFGLIFILYTVFSLKILQERKENEIDRAVFHIMQQANKVELSQLRKQEEEMQAYRHDLRHHVNYLDKLLDESQVEQAREYLSTILLEQARHTVYANHESVKLLVSQFQKQGKEQGVHLEIQLATTDFSGFDQLHLCSLLSNGLENALKFSKQHETPKVFLEIFREKHQLSIFIKNNFGKLPEFNNLRPITKEQGHGYGTKSMAAIVEEYQGFSEFYVEYGYFVFRATLMAKDL